MLLSIGRGKNWAFLAWARASGHRMLPWSPWLVLCIRRMRLTCGIKMHHFIQETCAWEEITSSISAGFVFVFVFKCIRLLPRNPLFLTRLLNFVSERAGCLQATAAGHICKRGMRCDGGRPPRNPLNNQPWRQ